jgi:hypothetical protein
MGWMSGQSGLISGKGRDISVLYGVQAGSGVRPECNGYPAFFLLE